MKSLGIDTDSTNFSAYRHCRVMIEFTGGHYNQDRRGGSAHKVIVPYTSFSKKLQSIHRVGGKIIDVSILHFQLDAANATHKEVLARIPKNIKISVEQSIEPLVAEADVIIAKDNEEFFVEKPIEESVVDPLEITVEAASLDVAEIIAEAESEQIDDYIADTIDSDSKILDSDSITETVNDNGVEAIAEIIAEEELESIVEILPEIIAEEELEPMVEILPEIIAKEELESIVEVQPEIIAEEVPPALEVVAATAANIDDTSSKESVLKAPTIELSESSPKSKKTKTSGKSGHGFNKQNENTKSSRKPKS